MARQAWQSSIATNLAARVPPSETAAGWEAVKQRMGNPPAYRIAFRPRKIEPSAGSQVPPGGPLSSSAQGPCRRADLRWLSAFPALVLSNSAGIS